MTKIFFLNQFSRSVFNVCSFDPFGNSDGLHRDALITLGNTDSLDSSLTLAGLETAVVAYGAEELKNKDSHSHDGQAHDKHHHPHRWTVGLCGKKQKHALFCTLIALLNYRNCHYQYKKQECFINLAHNGDYICREIKTTGANIFSKSP